MQTFLPHASFEKTAAVLDNRRLGNQRLEASIILQTIQQGGGWYRHPAVKMWIGYEDALACYLNCCINEWVARGFVNTMKRRKLPVSILLPTWLGKRRFHASHRAALLAKDSAWYGQFGWREKPEIAYFWPKPLENQG